ncbi:hypothetical protein KAH27_03570 [bacterium]|nr:hypothetical protein [bacterium]
MNAWDADGRFVVVVPQLLIMTLKLFKANNIANEESQRFAGHHNDRGNAMRHATWNRRMVEEIDTITALIAGVGHEIHGCFTKPEQMSNEQYFTMTLLKYIIIILYLKLMLNN